MRKVRKSAETTSFSSGDTHVYMHAGMCYNAVSREPAEINNDSRLIARLAIKKHFAKRNYHLVTNHFTIAL